MLVPIAVTWCDLCQSGMVYGREVAGRTLTLRVSGMLWLGNMVMEDLETGTLWSQLAGEGIRGELGADARAVATGGLADLVAPHSETIETVDPFLTLDGLRLVAELNA